MKYIVCEDTRSGYFFWQQINRVFFNGECIVKAKSGIGDLLKYISSVAGSTDSYLVCFDNCTDNRELRNSVSALRKLERQYNNIYLVQYICFEQVLASSDRIQDFIPNIVNDLKLHIAKEHISQDYTDVQLLKQLAQDSGIPDSEISTTERFFKPLIEDNCIIANHRLRNPNTGRPYQKVIMCHHYICKGSWSRCWSTDCVDDCPENYCWKTKNDCIHCNDKVANHTCYENESFDNVKRKYEEAVKCDRNLPLTQRERIRILFQNSIIKDIISA